MTTSNWILFLVAVAIVVFIFASHKAKRTEQRAIEGAMLKSEHACEPRREHWRMTAEEHLVRSYDNLVVRHRHTCGELVAERERLNNIRRQFRDPKTDSKALFDIAEAMKKSKLVWHVDGKPAEEIITLVAARLLNCEQDIHPTKEHRP